MEKTFETKYGEVILRNAMIDINGTDLVDGVEVKVDGHLVGEIIDSHLDFEEMTIKEVETLVETNCDGY